MSSHHERMRATAGKENQSFLELIINKPRTIPLFTVAHR